MASMKNRVGIYEDNGDWKNMKAVTSVKNVNSVAGMIAVTSVKSVTSAKNMKTVKSMNIMNAVRVMYPDVTSRNTAWTAIRWRGKS